MSNRKVVYTRYSVQCQDENFKLILCQHYKSEDGTHFEYIEFDFTNYAKMRDFTDLLEAAGVEMAR